MSSGPPSNKAHSFQQHITFITSCFRLNVIVLTPLIMLRLNAAELMTKATNAMLGPETGSGCFCSHFRGVCAQLGQRHVPHLEIKQGSLQTPPPTLSVSLSLNSS